LARQIDVDAKASTCLRSNIKNNNCYWTTKLTFPLAPGMLLPDPPNTAWTVYVPAARPLVAMGSCATPEEFGLALPSALLPSLKATVPEVTGALPLFTVAVRVVMLPCFTGFGEAVTETEVAGTGGVTVTVCVVEVEVRFVLFPL
jgi:hypothetical protein